MQQAIPPPGVQGQYGPAPGSGYPPQGYPQPQNMGVNPQGGYPTQASSTAPCMMAAEIILPYQMSQTAWICTDHQQTWGYLRVCL